MSCPARSPTERFRSAHPGSRVVQFDVGPPVRPGCSGHVGGRGDKDRLRGDVGCRNVDRVSRPVVNNRPIGEERTVGGGCGNVGEAVLDLIAGHGREDPIDLAIHVGFEVDLRLPSTSPSAGKRSTVTARSLSVQFTNPTLLRYPSSGRHIVTAGRRAPVVRRNGPALIKSTDELTVGSLVGLIERPAGHDEPVVGLIDPQRRGTGLTKHPVDGVPIAVGHPGLMT